MPSLIFNQLSTKITLKNVENNFLRQSWVKYLLHASGGSYDQNREWEIGNGYDGDDGRGLKR